MAKEAIDNNLDKPMSPMQEAEATPAVYQLPLKAACVLVDGVKQTTDVAKDLKHVIGKQEARKFYVDMHAQGKGLMPAKAFNKVDWKALSPETHAHRETQDVQPVVQQAVLRMV